MRHTLFLSMVLSILWLANSGHYTSLILILGAASIAFVVWIAHRMDLVDHEAQAITLKLRVPIYWVWLTKEIILSNIDVVKRIWLSPGSISPTVETLDVAQKTDLGRVVYANSITLTPGTVTLDLGDTSVTVHALSKEGMEGLKQSDMADRVLRVER